MRHYKIKLVEIIIAIFAVLVSAGVVLSDSLEPKAEVEITSCGCLNSADTTYVLQNDIVADKSCFAITAKNVTLDLNGHTITYDNAAPIVLANGDFENGAAGIPDDWDMSEAPNVVRNAGTYVQPVTVYSENYALKFSVPAFDQQVRSLNQVMLQPNTTYSISAMVFNNYHPTGQAYQSESISLFVGLDDGTIDKTAVQKGITWRGFQRINKTFTTGDLPESYYIKAGITGASEALVGNVYIDDIRIQKHRSVGIVVGPVSWRNPSRYPDFNQYGTATGAVIKNGSIIQGTANGDWSHAILIEGGSDSGFKIHDLHISVSGANTRAIDMNCIGSSEIYNNVIDSKVDTITSRDHYDGALVLSSYSGYNSKIYNNIINSGIQTGIFVCTAKDHSGDPIEISGNNITLQTKYTNDFAIVLYKDNGSLVYDNTINCGDKNNSCRGIFTGGNSIGSKIYNNTVSVQELKRNQEYGGCEMCGAYGIQVEPSIGAQVYGNKVTAYSGDCAAAALRLNLSEEKGSGEGALIHDNIFKAIAASGTQVSTSARILETDSSSADIRDNVFITNRYWMYFDGHAQGLVFTNNTFKTEGVLDTPFRPFQTCNYNSLFYPEDIILLDNAYPDEATKELFVNASFIRYPLTSVDLYSSFYYGWPLKITVKDNNNVISGASVNIKNVDSETVYSGVTDDNGEITVSLYEFRNKAGVKTYYNPYTISVSSGMFSKQQDITMDSAKAVVLSFGSELDPLDINQDGKIDILDVQLCVNALLGIEKTSTIVQKVKAAAEPKEVCNESDLQAVVNAVMRR